jgi:hypothetical protein
MFRIQRLRILGLILIVAALSLACGILPTPTPTPTPTLTPTDTPTPTSTPIPWETYANEEYGFSISYPDDWFTDEESVELDYGVGARAVFATSAEYIFTQEDGAALIILILPMPGVISLEELWDGVVGVSDMDIGEEEYVDIGGQEGLLALYEDRSNDEAGLFAMVIAYNQAFVLEASANPASAWDDYVDTFAAMLDSAEIFRPR